jgi:hypothetical protein
LLGDGAYVLSAVPIVSTWTSRGCPITWDDCVNTATNQRGGIVTFDGTPCLEYWVPAERYDAARVEVESEVFAAIERALRVSA